MESVSMATNVKQTTKAQRQEVLTLGREAQILLSFIKRNVKPDSMKRLQDSVIGQTDDDLLALKTELEKAATHVAIKTGRTPSGKMIRKEENEIVLRSKDGSKVLGRFPFGEGSKFKNERTAREAAARRERQVEFFKRQGKIWKTRLVTPDVLEAGFPEMAKVAKAMQVPLVDLAELPRHLMG